MGEDLLQERDRGAAEFRPDADGSGGRTVQMYCVVGAQDEPGTCDTPRERTSGEASAYSAVAEFAGAGDAGPLLLRSGSNAPTPAGR